MSYLPPFTEVCKGNRLSCPDTFILTCVSKRARHYRWQRTLTRQVPYEDVHSFWARVRDAMWALAGNAPEAHIQLQYVYGEVDPKAAEWYDRYMNLNWALLDVVRHCDEPEVRVEAADLLASLRADFSEFSVLYARPT